MTQPENLMTTSSEIGRNIDENVIKEDPTYVTRIYESGSNPYGVRGVPGCKECGGSGWKDKAKHPHPCNECAKITVPVIEKKIVAIVPNPNPGTDIAIEEGLQSGRVIGTINPVGENKFAPVLYGGKQLSEIQTANLNQNLENVTQTQTNIPVRNAGDNSELNQFQSAQEVLPTSDLERMNVLNKSFPIEGLHGQDTNAQSEKNVILTNVNEMKDDIISGRHLGTNEEDPSGIHLKTKDEKLREKLEEYISHPNMTVKDTPLLEQSVRDAIPSAFGGSNENIRHQPNVEPSSSPEPNLSAEVPIQRHLQFNVGEKMTGERTITDTEQSGNVIGKATPAFPVRHDTPLSKEKFRQFKVGSDCTICQGQGTMQENLLCKGCLEKSGICSECHNTGIKLIGHSICNCSYNKIEKALQ